MAERKCLQKQQWWNSGQALKLDNGLIQHCWGQKDQEGPPLGTELVRLLFCEVNTQFKKSISSVVCPTLFNPMYCSTPGFPVHHQTPGACSNSRPSSRWCHPTISFSVIPFPPAFNISQQQGLFKESVLCISGQSIGVSASASVLPKNIQDWFPLGWTGWISLQFKGLTGVFSNTTVQNHPFFGTQLSLWSNPLIHKWLLEKP